MNKFYHDQPVKHAMYLKSKGGKTPSGWHCQVLFYLLWNN